MDIAALSMAMSQANLNTQVDISLMKLVKDQVEVSGQDLVEQMKGLELSVNPNIGSNIDISI